MYQKKGDYAAAATYAEQALAGFRHALGAQSPTTANAEDDLGLAYISQGKFTDAEPLAREALSTDEKVQPDNWERYRAESLLGVSLAGQRKFAEAEPLLREGYQGLLARRDHIDVPDRYHLDLAHQWLVEPRQARGKPDKAAE
jgi:tetratricopeptide (TPR) repeat protein